MNRRGFSLVELMVAAGVMGVIALGVMKTMSSQSKSSKSIAQSFEETAILNEIRSILSTPGSCTSSFQGKNLLQVNSSASDYPSVELIKKQIPIATGGTYEVERYQVDPTKGYGEKNLKINSYRLYTSYSATPDPAKEVEVIQGALEGTAYLEIEFDRGAGVYSSRLIKKNIKLNVYFSSGVTNSNATIASCKSSASEIAMAPYLTSSWGSGPSDIGDSNGNYNGGWNSPRQCPSGQYVCGIRGREQSGYGIINFKVLCCNPF